MAKKKRAPKRRAYRVWTDAELKALKKFAKDRTPVAQISKLMKRTQATIRMKAYQLGMSVGHRRRRAK